MGPHVNVLRRPRPGTPAGLSAAHGPAPAPGRPSARRILGRVSATTRRGPVAVWLTGLSLYFLAVFHRSSLAVAGLAATERFGISAAQLSTFVMLQLVVYAGMQIPVGLLLDRFGPRRILTIGVVVLTLAQAAFALADTFAVALVARVFVGLGDAMTFVCVLRLVTTWFP